MSHRPAPRRRVLVPLILATVLAVEIASVAFAGGAREVGGKGPGSVDAASGPGVATAVASGTTPPDAGGRRQPQRDPAASRRAGEGPARRSVPAPGSVAVRVHVRPERNRGAVARPELAAEVRSVSASASIHHGRNHVWIPSLGIDRAVAPFPCDRARPPDNHVYRWGCGGRNNVYLLGHAYSVFEPLHDAYVSGRLRKGLTVDYADGAGVVRTYSVAWWRVVRPTSAAAWAWAPQPRPSMTLQTCLGAKSELRLIVRLTAID